MVEMREFLLKELGTLRHFPSSLSVSVKDGANIAF